ncbi:cyclopropane-fatty-acyl-phospholipid synthase family protein [soil metagenome]
MLARRILRGVFQAFGGKAPIPIRIEFADKSAWESHPGARPEVLIRFRTPHAEWRSLIFFYQGVFEGYVDEEVDIEGDNPITKLAILGHQQGYTPASFWSRLLQNPLNAIKQVAQEMHQNNINREQSIRNADFHYGTPPALFEHMLGETVGYSEGLWVPGTETINQAKFNLYEYVARKMRLDRPGLRVLEVGSGWGYMPIYLAKRYGADVTVYNPVRRQNEYMRERFKRHGVDIPVIDADHRDIMREAGKFDRFVSIGVHEHAGYALKQYRLWAKSIATALKDGGCGVVSTTSYMSRQMTNRLTLKYVFPGGHLPSLPDTLAAFDHAGLMMVEVENLWPHYERTMKMWRDRFADRWPEIQKADPKFFTESFRRRWTLYLEASSDSFRDALDLSHIVFTKGRSADHFPPVDTRHMPGDFMTGKAEPEAYR